MHLQVCLLVAATFALANGQYTVHEERKTTEHSGPLGGKSEVQEHSVKEERKPTMRREVGREHEKKSKSEFKLSERSKEKLVSDRNSHVLFEKQIEYYLKNPNTKAERECFDNYLKPGVSVDFVIDIAPSPSLDKVDKMVAESPFTLFYESSLISGTTAFFSAIQLFIDSVTVDMKSLSTHSIIYENGRKFYIRGRDIEDVESVDRLKARGEFMDEARNLKTLWPICTKEGFSVLEPIVKNNLGRMTKLALWNRDNGLPTVLASSRRSKPVFTIVITDGASGAKIEELAEDLTRTAVIDLGNRRFVRNMSWEDMRRIAGVYTLVTPKHLPLMQDTIRNMVCLSSEHASKNM